MVVCEEKKRVEERERKKYFLDVLVFSFSFFFFFLLKEKGGRGRPYVTYPLGRDLIGAPPARECWIEA